MGFGCGFAFLGPCASSFCLLSKSLSFGIPHNKLKMSTSRRDAEREMEEFAERMTEQMLHLTIRVQAIERWAASSDEDFRSDYQAANVAEMRRMASVLRQRYEARVAENRNAVRNGNAVEAVRLEGTGNCGFLLVEIFIFVAMIHVDGTVEMTEVERELESGSLLIFIK